MTEPNEFNEFRRQQERKERLTRRQMMAFDVLTVLMLVTITAFVLKRILY